MLQETKMIDHAEFVRKIKSQGSWRCFCRSGTGRGGGLITIAKSSLNPTLVNTSKDLIWILVDNIFWKASSGLNVINFYGTPASSASTKKMCFSRQPNLPWSYILAGDFNLNPRTGQHSATQALKTWLGANHYGSWELVDTHTWRRGDKKSTIDHFVIRNMHDSLSCSMKTISTPHVDNKSFSDHSAITLKISIDGEKSAKNCKMLFDPKIELGLKKRISDVWKSSKSPKSYSDLENIYKSIRETYIAYRRASPISKVQRFEIEEFKLRSTWKLRECDELPNKWITKKTQASKSSCLRKFESDEDQNRFVTYYEQLLRRTITSSPEDFKCKPRLEHSRWLTRPLRPNELYQTMRKLPRFKSPGPDGIPYEVFSCNSRTASNRLRELFNNWLKNGLDGDSRIKTGWMTLFHKDGDKNYPSNYRPITLLNTTYKIFSLVLVSSIMKQKNRIFCRQQKGFVNGRMGLDNILNCKVLLEEGHKVALLDFSKAFDSVGFMTILETLSMLGFDEKSTNLIATMLGGWTAIKTNSISPSFYCSRGVRQGDPLSPALFAIAIEPLLERLNSIGQANIGGLPTSALAFADDIALFDKEYSGIDRLTAIVKEFEMCSGLRLNAKKCVCLDDPMSEDLSQHHNISNFGVADTVKYLGIHVPFRSRMEVHQVPWLKFVDRLAKWKEYFAGSGVSAPGRSRLLISLCKLDSYLPSVL